MALGRALIYEGNETVLGTNPNRTHDQPKPYLETAETVLDLYSDKGIFPFLLRGAHKKNSLKIDAFPFQTVRETVLGQQLILSPSNMKICIFLDMGADGLC